MSLQFSDLSNATIDYITERMNVNAMYVRTRNLLQCYKHGYLNFGVKKANQKRQRQNRHGGRFKDGKSKEWFFICFVLAIAPKSNYSTHFYQSSHIMIYHFYTKFFSYKTTL